MSKYFHILLRCIYFKLELENFRLKASQNKIFFIKDVSSVVDRVKFALPRAEFKQT